MNLASPHPTPVVTNLDGLLPRPAVRVDRTLPEPATLPNFWFPTPHDPSLIDQLITEDDNPVDNLPSSKQQRLLVGALYSSWRTTESPRNFLADANIGMFYEVKEPPLVPDLFVSLNVQVADDWWAKEHRSYFFWEFGKPPEIVIEIVSNQEGGEADHKLREYAKMGIRYYVIFDPNQQLSKTVLRAYELQGTKYVKMKKPWFADLGLGLTQWTGTYEDKTDVWLRWCDHKGQLIPTGDENAEQQRRRAELESHRADLERRDKEMALRQAEQERRDKEMVQCQAEQERRDKEMALRQAEQERRDKEMALHQAEQERQRANQERQEKERLLAKLRALGIELEE